METKSDFEIYLERYCKKHRVSPEEAKKHLMVQLVRQYYKDDRRLAEGE